MRLRGKKLSPRESCRANARLRGFAWQHPRPLRHGLRRATLFPFLASPSSPDRGKSVKGRGFGSTAKLLVLPRALPLGELSPQVTERAHRQMVLTITHPSSVSSLRSSTPSLDRGKASVETASGMIEGSILALSVTACAVPPLPKGEALAKGQSSRVRHKPLHSPASALFSPLSLLAES